MHVAVVIKFLVVIYPLAPFLPSTPVNFDICVTFSIGAGEWTIIGVNNIGR